MKLYDLRKDLDEALEFYPNLKVIESGSNLALTGAVDLIHPTEKKLIDTFFVDITFPDRFPYQFPKVIETSGKIERIPDRHIHTGTNYMCFAVLSEELMKCRHGITTLWFLNHVLVPRLAEEYIVNNGGKYYREFSHGTLGDLEFYFEKFRTKSPKEVLRYLTWILRGDFPKHYELCYCGSGKKFKKCHRLIFEQLKGLGDGFLSFELQKLKKYIESITPRAL